MAQAKAAYLVKSWDRKTWGGKSAAGPTGAMLTRVEMSMIYEGDIEGEAIIQYLIADNGDGRGSFVALEKVTGSVGGRSGSYVFQRTGTFDSGRIKATLTVVPGSGTGDLIGLSGRTTLDMDQHQESYPITLDYEV